MSDDRGWVHPRETADDLAARRGPTGLEDAGSDWPTDPYAGGEPETLHEALGLLEREAGAARLDLLGARLQDLRLRIAAGDLGQENAAAFCDTRADALDVANRPVEQELVGAARAARDIYQRAASALRELA